MVNRIQELEKQITEYAQAYYSGEALVPDETFDSLVDELRSLSPESKILSKTGWGFEPEGKKVLHRYGLHIGSLSKVHSVGEIPESLLYSPLRVSAKLDGLSVVTYYENGLLTLALTRGNGTEGIDVTDKILHMHPNLAELNSKFTGAIRGEVVLPNDVWNNSEKYINLREEALKNGKTVNQRNVAAGYMNRGYLSEELKDLRYVCYKVLYSTTDTFSEIQGIEEFLKYNLFDIVPLVDLTVSFSDELFRTFYDTWCKTYPCDGIVLTHMLPELDYHELAYKFEAESKQVVVTKVTWNATRTGRLAPRAWFNEVELSGAMVKKATAFNASYVRDNRIGEGAIIEVRRSGEVIPDIVKVIKPADKVDLPEVCPNCNAPLSWSDTDLKCEYEDEAQLGYRYISVAAELEGVDF